MTRALEKRNILLKGNVIKPHRHAVRTGNPYFAPFSPSAAGQHRANGIAPRRPDGDRPRPPAPAKRPVISSPGQASISATTAVGHWGRGHAQEFSSATAEFRLIMRVGTHRGRRRALATACSPPLQNTAGSCRKDGPHSALAPAGMR